MPLSSPAARKELHTRVVTCKGYLREDDLWDIEGNMVDTKPYRFENQDRGGYIEAEEPLHGMWVRLTIDDQMKIHAAEAAIDYSPYSNCPSITPDYGKLVGLNIGLGWNKAVRTLLRGTAGCTHLTELLGPMATTAFQTLYSGRDQGKTPEVEKPLTYEPKERPALLNTCHTFGVSSPVVKRDFPEFYEESSE
ncbi:DUF2889 domain-containing protein [Leucothrix sargassi]|nr:DUF2889 domain-containing protein [Leucothrix sargassi]